MAKNVKGGILLDLLTYILLQNIINLEGGPFGDVKKFSKKSRTEPKNPNGRPFKHVGFLEKVKNEREPFGLSLPWPDLALGGFRNVSKKWIDKCEVCGLKKKRSLL